MAANWGVGVAAKASVHTSSLQTGHEAHLVSRCRLLHSDLLPWSLPPVLLPRRSRAPTVRTPCFFFKKILFFCGVFKKILECFVAYNRSSISLFVSLFDCYRADLRSSGASGGPCQHGAGECFFIRLCSCHGLSSGFSWALCSLVNCVV